jgi:aminoglycoside phosphotransferase (APT) family kinase protein
MVLLGGPSGLAARLVELGAARRVSRSIPNEGSADALVVLHDAHVGLEHAASCLVPGGALYSEIDRRSLRLLGSTPGRLRHSLLKRGLIMTGIYAVSPHFDRCEMYLPLDVPGALRWYVTTIYRASRPVQWALEHALRLLTGFRSDRFAILAPYCAVTAVAGEALEGLPSVLSLPSLPGVLQRHDLRPLALTDAGNRVTVLPFTPGGASPLAVLKIPKHAGFNSRTENEQAILTQIRSLLDAEMRSTVPEPLGMAAFGDINVAVESYIRGHALLRSCGRWSTPVGQKIEDLELAVAWLGKFHTQAQVWRRPWAEAELREWVENPWAVYRQQFGVRRDEESLFTCCQARARLLVGAPLPIVWHHRDFNIWNVYRAGREVSVIDWEGGRHGPPLCDLLLFLTNWVNAVRGLRGDSERMQGFRETFCQDSDGSRISEAVHASIERYVARLAIDRGFLPLLLVHTWVELALRRFDQQRLLGELRPDAGEGNYAVKYVRELAAHTGFLFHDGGA